jgi:hypothetical protein
MLTGLKLQEIFGISNDNEFEKIALRIYDFQKQNNLVYQKYLKQIKRFDQKVTNISEIPFLPISFFKSHEVTCNQEKAEIVFTSSGTGGKTSKHPVTDLKIYEKSYLEAFTKFYGDISDYIVLALLPSYLEREGSSLIYMTEDLIKRSNSELSGFFLHDFEELTQTLHRALASDKKILLIGVSFALLDYADKYQLDLNRVTIMETGGMKGRREEITREELHTILAKSFKVSKIHSEYGMTELLSQAYSKGDGKFLCPPWMKVVFRDTYDPFCPKENAGGVNIIDLANLYSCSFIETSDLGRKKENGFEILGRLDNSDIRGCNLMIQ